MEGMLLLAGAAGLVGSLGLAERWRHRRNLARIPIRVHVNGTRGKSCVTRLIAAGLRAGGLRTFAKTTGTLPRMIFPDGHEELVVRTGRANIIEQRAIVREAVRSGAEAMVLECMAVQPCLQSVCELQLVSATHGVITNARPDHLDAMGPTGADVARALAGTTPAGGKLFTAEEKYLDIFRAACLDRGSELIAVDRREIAEASFEDISRFTYIEHDENVALALRVCADLGVDRQTALEGMWRARPDAGVMTTHAIVEDGRRIELVNGFAANDAESTGRNWRLALDRHPHVSRRIALFNCRDDRMDRTLQLAEACAAWERADLYLAIGRGTDAFLRRAVARGIPRREIVCLENAPAERVFAEIVRHADWNTLVMGMGNVAGAGLPLVELFKQRAVSEELQLQNWEAA